MNSFFQSLAQYQTEILLAEGVLIIALVVGLFVALRRLAAIRSRWSVLLNGASGDNLERMLLDHLRDRMQLADNLRSVEQRLTDQEEKMQDAKRYVGLVRYDAFEDVGGSQSFALAVYDDRGNGAILSSLVGRNDCRVYCKTLVAGVSERNLSQEEQRAINEAKNKGPKTILSH